METISFLSTRRAGPGIDSAFADEAAPSEITSTAESGNKRRQAVLGMTRSTERVKEGYIGGVG